MSERASTKGLIVTGQVYPPIPVRQFDWCAWLDGQEEEGPRGWGETKEQATDALLDELCADRCLTSAEQKAQGSRCGCGGADDYCGCQNVPDDTTLGEWRAAFIKAEGLTNLADAPPGKPPSRGDRAMSGVDIAGLVERLRAAVDLGDRTGSRGKRPENIYNVADDALTALLAQAAEVEKLTGLLHANGGPRFNEAMRRAESTTRQRDEALAALKASEEALKACHAFLCGQAPNNDALLDLIDAALAKEGQS